MHNGRHGQADNPTVEPVATGHAYPIPTQPQNGWNQMSGGAKFGVGVGVGVAVTLAIVYICSEFFKSKRRD